MKTINPYELSKLVSPIYCGAPAPFFICHSTEEFNLLNQNAEYYLVNDVIQFATLIKEFEMTEPSKNYPLHDKNVWIPTKEIYIPDVWTSTGTILYELREGKPVPTDNCYIQVLGFVGYNNMFTLATSAGLYNISAMIWDVSGALKSNFNKVEAKTHLKHSSDNRAKKYLEGKRPQLSDLRFIYYMLFSEMDIYASARKAYGAYMSKDRVDKLRNTERIKNLITKELAVIIPNLAEQILKEYPIEEIAKDMKGIVKKTVDKDSKDFNHTHAIEAMKFILDNSVNAPAMLNRPQPKPLTDGTKIEQIGGTTIHTFDGNLNTLKESKPDDSEEAIVLDAKTKERLEKELGVPTGAYVNTDQPNNFSDVEKLFPDDLDAKL